MSWVKYWSKIKWSYFDVGCSFDVFDWMFYVICVILFTPDSPFDEKSFKTLHMTFWKFLSAFKINFILAVIVVIVVIDYLIIHFYQTIQSWLDTLVVRQTFKVDILQKWEESKLECRWEIKFFNEHFELLMITASHEQSSVQSCNEN